MTLANGSLLGPYRITSSLGAGGMGEVYGARDTRLDRDVAIKILPAALAHDEALRVRFQREAKTVSQLNHPHICQIYDVGVGGGDAGSESVHYLVMELVDGESLAERLMRGPLALGEVLTYGSQIAEALAAAHRAGIVHRDLKPGNIMITKTGAKLLDFGLAKTVGPGTISADAPTESHKPLTAEGTIVGTFQYMAPEQLEGLEADARTDIFALGAVLYEMATGKRAFSGRTRTSLIAAIVAGEPPPIRSFRPLTPPQLDHVIARCLEKESDARWQSAHDVAQELKWIATSPRLDVAPATSGIRRMALLTALLIAAVALGWMVAQAEKTQSVPGAIVSTITPPVETRIGAESWPVLSPDGRWLAIVAETDKRQQIWLRPLGSPDARPLPGTDGAFHLFWSPDSSAIGFFANEHLKKVSIQGGPPVTLCEVGANPRGGAWSPEGVILFAPASLGPLHRVSASGGRSEPVTTIDASTGEDTHRWPRFLPDGRSFLYMAGAGQIELDAVNAVYASRLGPSERTLVVRTRFHVEYAEGKLLFVRGNTLFAQTFDDSSHKLQGEPVELAKGVFTLPEIYVAAFSASANGALVYASGSAAAKMEIAWIDASGNRLSTVLPAADYSSWDVSPDGRSIALAIVDPAVGMDVWVHDLTRGTLTPVTRGGTGGVAVWSPDGRRIVYRRGEGLMVKDVPSDSPPETVWSSSIRGEPLAWSPDGKHLALSTFDPAGTDYDVSALSLDSKSLFPVAKTTAVEFPFGFSPDGAWLAYSSNISGQNEVYLVSFPDLSRRQQISVGGGGGTLWRSADEIWYGSGKEVVSVTLRQVDGVLHVSPPRTLFAFEKLAGLAAIPGDDRLLASLVTDELAQPEIVLVNHWPQLMKSRSND